MFITKRTVGRLVEARVFDLPHLEAVRSYSEAFVPHLRHTNERLVLCADHRPVVIYKPAVTDALVELFRALNARWARAALLVSPSNATLGLQLQRIVRESSGEIRRVVSEPSEALAFLSETLDVAERERLMSFLEEPLTPRPTA